MMIQCVMIKASKVSEEKAAARLTSHLKYLQYRQHNRECMQTKDHQFFNGHSDHIDHRWIHQSIMHERRGNVYYYRLLLSPAHDEPVNDWRHWTRAMMRDLENHVRQKLNWYALEHSAIDQPHVHVIVQGTGKDQKTGCARSITFHARDFVYLRELGRAYSEYELQRFLTETFWELDSGDEIHQETLQFGLLERD